MANIVTNIPLTYREPDGDLISPIKGKPTEVSDNVATELKNAGMAEDDAKLDSALDAFIEGSTENLVSNATIVRDKACAYSMKSLKTVYLPECTETGSEVFSQCTTLVSVKMPKCKKLGYQNFLGCENLKFVDMSATNFADTSPFSSAISLDTLVLRCESVPYWADGNFSLFGSTKFYKGSGGGTLYVPESLVNRYKTANMWKTYFGDGDARTKGDANNKILPIEGSEYEL